MIADIVSLDRERKKRANTPGPEPVIAHWRCRGYGCITLVGVTQTAFDVLAMFNAVLKQRRERPIAEDEVMYCERCAAARTAP